MKLLLPADEAYGSGNTRMADMFGSVQSYAMNGVNFSYPNMGFFNPQVPVYGGWYGIFKYLLNILLNRAGLVPVLQIIYFKSPQQYVQHEQHLWKGHLVSQFHLNESHP